MISSNSELQQLCMGRSLHEEDEWSPSSILELCSIGGSEVIFREDVMQALARQRTNTHQNDTRSLCMCVIAVTKVHIP